MGVNDKTVTYSESNDSISFEDDLLEVVFDKDGDLQIEIESSYQGYESVYLSKKNAQQLIDWLVKNSKSKSNNSSAGEK